MKFFAHLKSINIPAFLFSCFFVVYGLINISEVLWIKCVMGGLGLFIEWEAQKVWGLSFAYKKAGKASWWLKTIYIWYVIVFALLSGIGFFATEINVQETAAEKIKIIESNTQRRIDQIYAQIDRVSRQLEREGITGIGSKYQALQTELDAYNTELKSLLSQSKTEVKVETKAQIKDMFANVSAVLWGFPKNAIIIIMFSSALFMVYLGLMLKPMEIEIEQLKPLPKMSEDETFDVKPETFSLDSVTDVTGLHEKVCRICGKKFLATRNDALYCGVNCRVKAHRNNLALKEI